MTTEKLELKFTGGLAGLAIRKQSKTGAIENMVDASSLITLKRQSLLPFTKRYERQPGDDYEVQAFLWQTNRYGDKNPVSLKSDSFAGALFNGMSRRVIWLTLAIWGELSMAKMLNAVNSNGHKGLEAAVSGTLSRAVHRDVLHKNGKGINAKYQIASGADSHALSEYLPFQPSQTAKEIVCARAKALATRKN